VSAFATWTTKRRLIELLKEQKQNVINQAVTRGLDPNVKLKPSGVEWIGDIPEHWEVRKLKHIAAMKSGDNLTSDQIGEAGKYPVYGGNGLRGYFNTTATLRILTLEPLGFFFFYAKGRRCGFG
jgi:restriction endonuclease S subunit